jgi:hypothetical protein
VTDRLSRRAEALNSLAPSGGPMTGRNTRTNCFLDA